MSKVLSTFGFLLYLILSLPLAKPALCNIDKDLFIKLAALLMGAGLTTLFAIRRPNPSKGSILSSGLFHMAILILGFCLIGVNAIDNFASEKPILTIQMTGVIKKKEIEWKNPDGPMQRSYIDCHEVILKNVDGYQLACYSLPGDLIAIRAKTFRFHPILNALGITSKYRIDLIYSGYRRAEKYRTLPIEAHPLQGRESPFLSLLFKYWESFFCKTADSVWIKSAACESNYFPMEDENGNPVTGEFSLNISMFGLSSM